MLCVGTVEPTQHETQGLMKKCSCYQKLMLSEQLGIQCNLSYPGSLGPRGARNCESARKYESSTTCVYVETLHTLNILFSLISFKQ